MSKRVASCTCGQLHLECAAEPLRVSVCHCLACQRRTGSVFGAQARFPRAGVEVHGTATRFVRVGDEGTSMTFHFCPTCGTTLFWSADDTDSVAVALGAFDDPRAFAPSVSVYEERRHPWVHVDAVEHLD